MDDLGIRFMHGHSAKISVVAYGVLNSFENKPVTIIELLTILVHLVS